MIYNIKQKILCINDTFSIKDGNNDNIFIVKSQFLSVGKKLKIFNLENKELIYIEKQFFTLFPEYHVYEDNSIIAKCKKEMTFFKPKINIESKNGNIKIKGDIFDYNYTIIKNNIIVA